MVSTKTVARYLNQHDYQKKKRQNNTLDSFSSNFVRKVLENPIYCGKLAYGRRKNVKIPGTRNQYHVVAQESYPVYEGIHESIISEEVWSLAQKRREATGGRNEKIYHPDRENIMSGLLKCPICGSGMYGNVNRKRKKDGTLYKDYYYYACKHRLEVDGHHCDYKKQWGQERINDAVEEVILRLVQTPSFEEAIREKIGAQINTDEMDAELTALQKKLRQLSGAKNKLGQQMDKLDISDRHYDRKYQDMETRMYALYDDIDAVEQSISEIETRIMDVRQQKISGDNVYQFLLYYDKLYDKFSDAEKKEFMNSFIEKVEIFPQEQPDGRFLRSISFQFPVYFDGKEVQKLSWDDESTVETVVLLTRQKL